MQAQFRQITTMDALQQELAQAGHNPLIVFKHDPHCRISAAAYRRLTPLTDQTVLVDVEADNDLAQSIASTTGIPHASPQVLLMKDGNVTWSADLYDITQQAVEAAIAG